MISNRKTQKRNVIVGAALGVDIANAWNIMLKCATSRKVAQDRRGTARGYQCATILRRSNICLLCFGIVFWFCVSYVFCVLINFSFQSTVGRILRSNDDFNASRGLELYFRRMGRCNWRTFASSMDPEPCRRMHTPRVEWLTGVQKERILLENWKKQKCNCPTESKTT